MHSYTFQWGYWYNKTRTIKDYISNYITGWVMLIYHSSILHVQQDQDRKVNGTVWKGYSIYYWKYFFFQFVKKVIIYKKNILSSSKRRVMRFVLKTNTALFTHSYFKSVKELQTFSLILTNCFECVLSFSLW